MVGNSSSGLIEAASVPLPVVNIGNRQKGRERASNVIDAPPERAALCGAIARALSPDFRRSLAPLKNPYGDGRASVRIRGILGTLPPRDRLLTKRFVDWTPVAP
jgi:UDP-N-acetylglucosamine 2-epimerase